MDFDKALKDAVEYVELYQSWRRGETDKTMDELGLESKKIGKAIDVVLLAAQAVLDKWRKE